MREIKFRAWSINDKKMLHDVGYHPTELEARSVDPQSGYKSGDRGNYTITPLAEAYALMQFTGLLDKNGVEIYEGDVVQYPTLFGFHKTQVIFIDARFCLMDLDQEIYRKIPRDRGSKVEVIGNIYSNPELINEKTN